MVGGLGARTTLIATELRSRGDVDMIHGWRVRAPVAQRTHHLIADRCTARAPGSSAVMLLEVRGASDVHRAMNTSRSNVGRVHSEQCSGLLLTLPGAPCHAGDVSSPHVSRNPIRPARAPPWEATKAAPWLITTTPQQANQEPHMIKIRRPQPTANCTECACALYGLRIP